MNETALFSPPLNWGYPGIDFCKGYVRFNQILEKYRFIFVEYKTRNHYHIAVYTLNPYILPEYSKLPSPFPLFHNRLPHQIPPSQTS